ncbi:MAG TPA: hypothetical protein VLC51_05035, partial [Nitrospira sp.]|nr:hypothetical protein [Nitrospira sp.]
MALRRPNRAICYFAFGVLTGCSDAVHMARETETGGIVTYLYKEERGGPMGSPHRKEALQAIERKCPAGYIVIRDGEVKGTPMISAQEGQTDEDSGRR